MQAPRRPALTARRISRTAGRYRSGIRPLEDRVSMSASPWSQLDLDEATALLSGAHYVQNELIVAVKNTAGSFADVLAIESARDAVTAAAVTNQLQLAAATDQASALYRLTLDAGADFAGVLSAISNWTSVEWVAPDLIVAAGGPEAADAPASDSSVVTPMVTSQVIALAARRDTVYDGLRNALWVTTSSGLLNRYDAVTGSLVSSWQVGVTLNGADITPDGRYLYIADGAPSVTHGFIRKVDLFTGSVKTIAYALDAEETGAFDVQISADGKVFFTANADDNRAMPLRAINTADDTVSTPKTIFNGSQISRGASRNLLLFTESNLGNGMIFNYDVPTGTFPSVFETGTNLTNSISAVSRDGLFVALEAGSNLSIRNASALNSAVTTLFGLDGGATFDPVRNRLYAVNSTTDRIEIYDTTTWSLQSSFAIGENVGVSTPFGSGNLAASDDGRRLYLTTATGIRMFDLEDPFLPTARSETYLAVEGTPLDVAAAAGVLANDQGTSLTAAVKLGPQHGTLSLNSDGSFGYTPHAGYTGFDTFTYTAGDGANTSNIGYVAVQVRAATNGAPVVAADTYYTLKNASLTVTAANGVLANDSDPDFDPLTVSVVAGPSHGTLTLNANGSFTYNPTSGYVGNDAFRYRAVDSFGASTQATVTLNVLPNDAPTLINVANRRDHVVDVGRNMLYVATSAGTIERVNITTGARLTAWTLGVDPLGGMDITADGKYLYVGHDNVSAGQGFIRKIDLDTGAVTTIPFEVGPSEWGVWDLEISADGYAFFTTQYLGTGDNPLHRLNLADNTVSDFGRVQKDTNIARSLDGKLLFFTQSSTSSGPIHTYDAVTHLMNDATYVNESLDDVESAVNRDGTLIAMDGDFGLSILDRNLVGVRYIPGLTGGVIFDPVRDVLYAVDPAADQLVAISTITWKELYRRAIGENVAKSVSFAEGVTSIAADGSRLFLSTPAGIRSFLLGNAGLPLISPVATQTTPEDAAITIDFTIADFNTSAGTHVVSATSSNTGLVSNIGLTVTYLGGDAWRLTATPEANQFGSTVITISAGDGSVTSSGTFTLNVTAVNDAPSFVGGPDLKIGSDTEPRTYTGWASSISTGPGESQGRTFLVTNDNPGLFSVQPTINSAGNLSYTPVLNVQGTAVVSVRLQDNGGTANGGVDTSDVRTFTISMSAHSKIVEDFPAVTINEDESVTVLFTVTDLDTPLDTLIVNTNGYSGILVPPSSRVLTYLGGGHYRLVVTPTANLSGLATIIIGVTDTFGGMSKSFNLTVNSVNDAPSFTKGSDQRAASDGVARSVDGWASNISEGTNELGQSPAFVMSNNNNGLFAVQPTISSTGTLTFTPAVGAEGTATVSVRLQDNGGTANGGSDTSPVQTFVITVVDEVGRPPQVAGVYVRGSAWTSTFLDHLDSGGWGAADSPGLGYALAGGASQTDVTIPWSNVDRITIQFDRDVTATVDSLTLYGSSGLPIAATAIRRLDGRTLEWTVPTLGSDKYLVHLDAATVHGTADLALDGEWTTSVTTWTQGSGDGLAGGDFNFRFNVLPGDFDSSGSVAFGEIGQARLKLGLDTASAGYDYRQDYDGTGSITFGEIGQARGRLGTGISGFDDPPTPPDSLEFQDASEQDIVAEPTVLFDDVFQSVASTPEFFEWEGRSANEDSAPETSDFAAASSFAVPEFVASPLFLEPAPVIERAFAPLGSSPPALATFGIADSVARRQAFDGPTYDLPTARFARLAPANVTAGVAAIDRPSALSGLRSQPLSTVRSELRPDAVRHEPGPDEAGTARAPRFDHPSNSEAVRGWQRLRRRTDAAAGIGDDAPSAPGGSRE